MADEEERVKAEKLAAAKKRVSIAHSGLKPAYNAEMVNIILIHAFRTGGPIAETKEESQQEVCRSRRSQGIGIPQRLGHSCGGNARTGREAR